MIEIDFSKFSPEDQARMRTVAFGDDIKHFLQSTVGQYLLARNEAERKQAIEQLAEVDASDANAIRELQMIVKRCDSFGFWLAEAQVAADNAEEELENRE